MPRFHRTFAVVILAALITGVGVDPAPAALAPSTVKKMKDGATDVLQVKITKVEKKGVEGGRLRLVYTATVTKVDRSKSGRKVGDSIRIASYRHVALLPRIGPKNPPLLDADWIGTVYLNASKVEGPYKLAVFGHSFVAKGD